MCPPSSDSDQCRGIVAQRRAHRCPLLPHVNMPARVFVASSARCPRQPSRAGDWCAECETAVHYGVTMLNEGSGRSMTPRNCCNAD